MGNILSTDLIDQFNNDGAVLIKGKFDRKWIETLREGISKDINNPSPRFERHTKDDDAPGYYEDFWSWDLYDEFKDFLYNSPMAQMGSELLDANQINLVMDNWFLREAGSKSGAPFHHDISYFDFDGSMCVLWLPLEPVNKEEGIAWIKGSHLWDKLFIRTRFQEGHPNDGRAGIVNGKTYDITPDILKTKNDYEFLQWDLELGDCVFFDIRTMHGSLSQSIPKNDSHRYTLRMAKEGSKIEYRGDWAQVERAIFEANGYQNGDDLSGKMFPTLYQRDTL